MPKYIASRTGYVETEKVSSQSNFLTSQKHDICCAVVHPHFNGVTQFLIECFH